MNRNLIFDIGLHKGLDAEWYLAKGFNVIGLEASKSLCQLAHKNNKKAVSEGRLTIIEKALFDDNNSTIPFFEVSEKDDWGSIYRGDAEKGIYKADETTVSTITLFDLIEEYGCPYYIKCDIEGGDAIFARQVVGLKELPVFVSIEFTSAVDLCNLAAAGYDRFQIVNQWNNPFIKAPTTAKEGVYAPSSFSHETSGLFGLELAEDKWIEVEEALDRFLKWYNLRDKDETLAIGWLDIHATKSEFMSD